MTTQAGRISNYMNSGSDDAVNERCGVYDFNVIIQDYSVKPVIQGESCGLQATVPAVFCTNIRIKTPENVAPETTINFLSSVYCK